MPAYLGIKYINGTPLPVIAMNACCPECDSGLGELVEKYAIEGVAKASFQCHSCEHEWTIVL
jgi:transposase-like protein